MENVRFKIDKLGAIRNSSFTLSPLMIFSGESGLGKSYAAFLVHYLFILLQGDRLKHFFEFKKYNFKEIFASKVSGKAILSVPVDEFRQWINKDAITYIGYLIGNSQLEGKVSIEIPIKDKNFEFIYNEELRGLNNQEEIYYSISLDNFTYSVVASKFIEDSTSFYALLAAVLRDTVFGDYKDLSSAYLLPPSRGSLMELDERPSFSSGMYDEFWDLKLAISRPLSKPTTLNSKILSCVQTVNKGNIERVDGKFMYFTNGVSMSLTAAASSIKELAPLTLFLNKYPVNKVSMLLEEPEAHLHPIRQSYLADLIACMVNGGAYLQLTTHSDYFLKRLNSLIKLSELKSKMDAKSFHDFISKWQIDESYLLNVENVASFYLKDSGHGYSTIINQNIVADEEIPFDSFYSAIKDDMELSREINDLLKS